MSVSSISLLAFIAMSVSGPATVETRPSPHFAIASPSQAERAGFLELNRQMMLAAEQGDFAGVLSATTLMIRHPVFPELPAEIRANLHMVVAGSLFELERYDEALAAAQAGIAIDPANPELWFVAIDSLNRQERFEEVGILLADGIRQSADLRSRVSEDYVYGLLARDRLTQATAFALRAALFESGWRDQHASWTWLTLTRERLDRGDTQGADEAARAITASSALIALHSSRRFSDLPAVRAGFDFGAVLEAELTRLRAEAEAGGLEERQSLASALLARGQLDESLSVIDAALAVPPTDDTDEDWDMYTWLLDTRSRVLMTAGRYDEAYLAQQTAAGRLEQSGRNVSQQINLGWMSLRLDRPEDAQRAVALVSDDLVSNYGRMQAAQVRACAAQALGQEDVVAETMTQLSEHWRDAPGAYYDALACRGDHDAMAALMIARLQDPELTDGAISAMHAYLPAPNPTPFDTRINAAHTAVIARPEVIAARDAVGVRLEVPLLRSGF